MSKKTLAIAAMVAITPVKVRGEIVPPDEEFEIEERYVPQLLESHSARRKSDPAPDDNGGGDDEQKAWAARIEAIKGAIANLEAEDPERKNDLFWRQDKTPRAKALADRLEFKPTPEDIADALKVIEEEKADG